MNSNTQITLDENKNTNKETKTAKPTNKLGAILHEARKELGLSYRQAAKVVNRSHAYIAMLEKGTCYRENEPVPTYETLLAFSIGYGMPLDRLIEAAGLNVIQHTKDQDAYLTRIERNTLFLERFLQLKEEEQLTLEDIELESRLSKKRIMYFEQCAQQLDQLSQDDLYNIEVITEDIYSLAPSFGVSPSYLAGYTANRNEDHPDMPKLKEISDFLINNNVMHDGIPLTEEDKHRVRNMLQVLFMDAKRKTIEEERTRKNKTKK
ncbi:helix-turn-helix domain-containing protein [Paenibacillus hunanensis]|uniref:helix-turn-helix domain-containing protein n=1 Tax=Paenibacillus hunanensis TaxID=539262 RepID=UPI0020268023|nr:helix-turn-helix transcriptional regulator [Paenibacillus hunanensis]MCL9662110.1 helix-turn-helix domain-containing protein [Paenibacillus hunanensis]